MFERGFGDGTFEDRVLNPIEELFEELVDLSNTFLGHIIDDDDVQDSASKSEGMVFLIAKKVFDEFVAFKANQIAIAGTAFEDRMTDGIRDTRIEDGDEGIKSRVGEPVTDRGVKIIIREFMLIDDPKHHPCSDKRLKYICDIKGKRVSTFQWFVYEGYCGVKIGSADLGEDQCIKQ